MIEVFKSVKGINKEKIDHVLEITSQDRTRGNGYKLEKVRFRTDLGRYWFTNNCEQLEQAGQTSSKC